MTETAFIGCWVRRLMARTPAAATAEGTQRYARRHDRDEVGGHRTAWGLKLSSIGIGTYLGDPSDEKDLDYERAVAAALRGGINVVDSAINYRNQRSERAVGRAVAQLLEDEAVARDEVFVSTKGGFLAFDDALDDPQAAVQEDYVNTRLITEENFAAGCHCMDAPYLKDQIRRSRSNLGLDTIDLYYVHNPETQFAAVDEKVFYERLTAAFTALEGAVADGHIARYGLATWDGLRKPAGQAGHFGLARAVACAEAAAEAAGAKAHHLAAVQAPLNLAMVETVRIPAQTLPDGRTVPLAEACAALGLVLFTSASILQGRLARGVPKALKGSLSFDADDAQVALHATRTAPGVTTALVGMSQKPHVDAALALLRRAPPEAASLWASS